MKKLLLFMLPLVALSFIACDKGDGNGGDETITGKLVKTIHYDHGSYDSTCTFTYDSQGRLTKIADEYDGEESVINYTYSTNRIVADWDDGDFIYTLNVDGYLIKKEWERSDDYIDYSYQNGYLKQAVEDSNDAADYTWENGNLVEVFWQAHGEYADTDMETYTYTDKENKLNLNIFEVIVWDYPHEEEFLKFKGASPKNLPASDSNSSCTYKLDSDGYPTEIIKSFSDGETDTTVITITYY